MSLDNHISSIIESCFMQLCDFCRIRLLISKTAAITLADLFLHSRRDYCKNLFYNFPNYSIHHLQKVQNTTAHIVNRSVCSSHITSILKFLHWLPVNYRINFKIFCITHHALSLHEPHYLSSLFSLGSNSHSLRSSSLAYCYYHILIKNHMVFVHSHMLHLISGIIYPIMFVLHQPNIIIIYKSIAIPITIHF